MNKTVLINFIILTSFIFSQCHDYNEAQCSNDNNCEWVEDIEIGDCSVFDNSESFCTSYPGECFWDEDITYAPCDYPNSGICNSYQGCYWDCFYGYCDCNGQQQIVDTECIGQYETDNSYCQEIEMPDCSELDQNTCNHPLYGEGCDWIGGDIDCIDLNTEANCSINNCNWIENISSFNCAQFGSSSSCSNYSDYGCSWEWSWGGWGNHGSSCVGGAFQIDNSYCEGESGQCEESSDLIGDMNYDGVINVQDVINIIDLILNQEYNHLGDMNNDNILNVADIIQIINIILN